MKKLLIFVAFLTLGCSSNDDGPRAICGTDLGITKDARKPFDYIEEYDQLNKWFWKRDSDSLTVFAVSQGIDTYKVFEYTFLAPEGDCVAPLKYRTRSTNDELPFGESEVPVIYEYDFTVAVQSYSTAKLVGRFLAQEVMNNGEREVWADFKQENEVPNYTIENPFITTF